VTVACDSQQIKHLAPDTQTHTHTQTLYDVLWLPPQTQWTCCVDNSTAKELNLRSWRSAHYHSNSPCPW